MAADGLSRFVEAQDPVIEQAMAELAQGRKRSHWMWFVFPQITGIGYSPTARYFAIQDLAEARAYLAHPVLAARLRDGVRVLLGHAGTEPAAILGKVDAAKFQSCLTLFRRAASLDADRDLFDAALKAFYGGAEDQRTLGLLHASEKD